MNWKRLGKLTRDTAPALATVLAGPAAGMAASLIAKQFGAEETADEAAIIAKMQTNPHQAMLLRQIELDHIQTLMRLDAELQQKTQDTYRAELVSNSAFARGWRPLYGYVYSINWGWLVFGLVNLLFYALVVAIATNDFSLVRDFVDVVKIFIESTWQLWLMVTSIFGLNVMSRSRDKRHASHPPDPRNLTRRIADVIKPN